MKRSRATSLVILLACHAIMPMSASVAATPSCKPVRYTNAEETKWRATTTNFAVWNYSPGHDAARIAKECEKCVSSSANIGAAHVVSTTGLRRA